MRCSGALAELGAEPALHLPQLGAIHAVVFQDDLGREDERAKRRLERVGVADLEQACSAAPELLEHKEGVAVGLRLLEHEAQTGPQAAAGSSSSMPSDRAMRSAILKPMRGSSVSRYGSCLSTATTSSPYWRTSRAASPALIPCVKRNVSTSRIVATSRQAAIARSTLLREIARPAFVRTSRSRSGSRSSSAKTCSAPKWSTIARANVGPIPGTRAVNQSATPSGGLGSAEWKDSTTNCQPCRACSANAPAQTSCSPAVTCPRGPVSVIASPSVPRRERRSRPRTPRRRRHSAGLTATA